MRAADLYFPIVTLLGLVVSLVPPFSVAQTTETTAAAPAEKPAVFRIKYIAEDAVYLEGGRNASLEEGMKLSVIEVPPGVEISNGLRFRGDPHIAELKVVSVAESSSVCEISTTNGEIKVGQAAFLSPDSVVERRQEEFVADSQNYPIVVTFTNGDPLDEEIRETQSPHNVEASRGVARGRIGFDYGGISEGPGLNSTQVGMLVESDVTHIGGTYWNLTGYWRGRLNTTTSGLAGATTNTLFDLINRTYTLGLYYQNPYSAVTLGIGRLYLPWAPSLSTIDGGYFGRKMFRIATVGVFGGSTPNPASWSYAPDEHIGGAFLNFTGGKYDGFHFMSTGGVAVTSIQWKVARQFLFFENNYSWKRFISLYNSLQADEARVSPLPNGGSNPTGVSQSYSSLHIQPISQLTFGINHNYFRNLPTFDPALLGTGLLDQYLFQGFSADVTVQLPLRITVYSGLGRSKTSSDTKQSWNESYGLSFGRLWNTGLRADLHYSKFDSTFGSGKYESVSLSKNLSDAFRLQFQGGVQAFNSPLSNNGTSKFIDATADWNIGRRYFMQGDFGLYRGTTLNYKEWHTLVGYRFGGLRR
ncbi:MAG TPA: hypothetical protein VE077_13455 [Candidatus Methylomirabilis sp.]|nr:hypothetical protein [Candidatus Methylomirabilis sp.]